jgi:1-acyl-sn-glycerol-3-phosphate acyltransferase
MLPFIVGVRLALVGLHLLYGAFQVAVLFPFCSAGWKQRLKRRWSRQLVTLLGIRVASANESLAGMDHGLLVANHVSFIDIFVINAVLPCAFVAKSEVAQWPLIGWLAGHADTIFIQRGSRKAAHRTHQQMVEALGAGRRLAIFPEGTTTAGDRLLPFHAALFQSAIDAAVPVHALALSYHAANGERSTAPAYIDDVSLTDCLLSVLQAGGLEARVTLAGQFVPPLTDRRHLAHRAHHAVATALAHEAGHAPAPSMHEPSPGNRGGIPQIEAAQLPGNEAAIRR